MDLNGQQFDVIVVGAGIMGSATAYQLTKRGKRVILLEQFDFLHHRGSSHGESRTIRAAYAKDYYCSMAIQSSRLWEEAESEIGYKVYFKSPHLDMGPADDESLLAIISSCRKNSIGCRVLDKRQLEEEFSGRVKIPEDWIGVCTDLGGVIKPTKAVSMFQTLAFQRGAVLRDRTEVKGIVKDEERGGIRVLIGDGDGGGEIRAEKCVITAGAWTEKLVKKVSRIELPIQAVETTVCYWRVREGYEGKFSIEGEFRFPTFASYGEPHLYGTPSMEYPGLMKIAVHDGYPCDPDKRVWGPGKSVEELKEWIEERFGGMVVGLGGPEAKQSCMYSMTPDEDYVIDFVGEEFGKDVVVGGGFSGHGFKMGPAVGKILADLAVDGDAKGFEGLQCFRIQRFEPTN
ncbi:Probable sarcosine oxidase [Linum perenne]